jgi:hypothetical protein|tara:strand:+ start:727 stop:894 length:168 start_codon:yes stop_codon:yes gene_type:complete
MVGIDSGNGTFTEVGSIGTLITSTDVIIWNLRTSPAGTEDLFRFTLNKQYTISCD